MHSLKPGQLEDLLTARYRGWITNYWSEVCEAIPDKTLPEKKETFFFLIKLLLDERKVQFDHPKAAGLWDAPSNVILEHLRELWPTTVIDEDDVELTTYFYKIPGISWLSENGEWLGS